MKKYPIKKSLTILEVIVSVVILSMGLVIISFSFMKSLKTVQILSDSSRACDLLENKFWLLWTKSMTKNLVLEKQQGTQGNLEWEYRVDSLENEEGYFGELKEKDLKDVFVSVSFGEREISVETCLK